MPGPFCFPAESMGTPNVGRAKADPDYLSEQEFGVLHVLNYMPAYHSVEDSFSEGQMLSITENESAPIGHFFDVTVYVSFWYQAVYSATDVQGEHISHPNIAFCPL